MSWRSPAGSDTLLVVVGSRGGGATRVSSGGTFRDGGDEALIRTLYQEHGRSLLAYATRLTGDRAAAEDVVQETLLRAWKHSASMVEEHGSVRGWLLTVARNIITDRVRARAARPQEVAESPATPPVAHDHAQGVADTVTMLGALNQLSPEHREVLVEMYYRGRTVVETAAALGVPPGTVKSRSFYALRALRGVLGSGPRDGGGSHDEGGPRGGSAREAVS